ncbi:hypothetical protein AZSI13_06710 [Azospira sp. I13]|nr:hypothetical protein AZSI13_06710 [Azospira sp. I13]
MLALILALGSPSQTQLPPSVQLALLAPVHKPVGSPWASGIPNDRQRVANHFFGSPPKQTWMAATKGLRCFRVRQAGTEVRRTLDAEDWEFIFINRKEKRGKTGEKQTAGEMPE